MDPLAQRDQQMVELDGVAIETFHGGPPDGAPVVCAAHPASAFSAETAALLAELTGTRVVCANPRGLGASTPSERCSLEQMVDDIEAVRAALGLGAWIFWGMSGGGWLAQIYAHRHPDALVGVVVESACLCFRERLADPACVLSPFFPSWREPLVACGLLDDDSHAAPRPDGEAARDETEWIDVDGVGAVFRRHNGPALLVSPMPVDDEMRRAMPALWAFDARSWIGDVRVPALVLCGGQDPVVPVRSARAVHEALAGSLFVVVDEAGHVPTAARRPEVADAFRDFVAAATEARR